MVIFAACIRKKYRYSIIDLLCYKIKYESIIRENEQI